MKNIIFIAPPASGKGTQSELLEDNMNYIHLSTGDLLREEINKRSEIGISVKNIMQSGGLVSDEVVTNLLNKKILSIKDKPFILDGYPRTMIQAQEMDNLFDSNNMNDYVVIYLEVPYEESEERALSRLVCSCGKSYNLLDPKLRPEHGDKCDDCGKTLLRRSDDTKEKFKERFEAYLEKTAPVVEYYKQKGKLEMVDASINPEVTYNQIEEILK